MRRMLEGDLQEIERELGEKLTGGSPTDTADFSVRAVVQLLNEVRILRKERDALLIPQRQVA